MKKILTVVLIFIVSQNIFAQTFQNPKPINLVKAAAGFVNGSKTWIAGDNGMIAYSPNSGKNWNVVNYGGYNLKSIFFASASTGFAAGEYSVIYKTTDAGLSWIKQTLPGAMAHYNSIFFTDANTGYTGGGNGVLLKTTNCGLSWINIGNVISNLGEIQFINQNTGFIVETSGYVKKTTNAGLNWFIISDTSVHTPQHVQFINENTGWCAGVEAVYKTTNAGASWINQYNLVALSNGLKFINSQTGYVTSKGSIIKTTNGGNTWEAKEISDIFYMGNITPVNDSCTLVFENTGKIYRSTDYGIDWKTTSSYLTDRAITDIKFAGALRGWACTDINYFLRTTNGGNNWDTINIGGANTIARILVSDSLNVWGVSSNNTIAKSSDGGLTWSFGHKPNNNFISNGCFVNKTSARFISSDGTKLISTDNRGVSYFEFNLPEGMMPSGIQFITPSIGYISCGGGAERIYRTDNGGGNWRAVGGIHSQYGKCMSFIDANTGWLGADNKLLMTTNGGENWSERSLPAGLFLTDLKLITGNFGIATFAGGILCETYDGGITWNQIKVVAYELFSIAAVNFSNWWVGGTYGTIYKGAGAIIDDIKGNTYSEKSYSLEQNYPNPFNPNTVISYRLSVAGIVSLKVFDLLGKEVASLVNEKQSAGSYAVDFNSAENNLPSGIYFYTLSAGEFKETRKMILIK